MKLELLQKQKMVMTPHLNQAITMLQYNTVEMEQFIQEESLENPMIELEEPKQDVSFSEDIPMSTYQAKPSSYMEEDQLDTLSGEEKCLTDHLNDQVCLLNLQEKERVILNYLILSLDENGYLTICSDEAARLLRVSEADVENGISLLQQLEPAGVGARSLQECLLLQLGAYHPHDQAAEQVISEHLNELAQHNWKQLASLLAISLEQVKSIAQLIQSLDPKPGAAISPPSTKYLVPDIILEKVAGTYTISLNDRFIPGIRLNKQYSNYLGQNNDASAYLSKHYQRYMWLLKSIEQRRTTIVNVTKVIIEKQMDFLETGNMGALQPMTMKDVAEEIDVHESTVSRATKNKVIQTPKGTYELRLFFTSKLGENEDGTSSAKVKTLLKQLITSENKKRPLSDQKISDHFKNEEDVKVSRRTIAKYREELRILPSSRRKEI
ncbi:RNA polymerase factor sigma-54 [Halobacillus naozhouensis]|uniref:RNA polymerase factor sigma-54 n=1 Tax=Halobacillus naozhouensis TaxID=554880 RepID=A0ABY8IXQ6_9BACI|nr:RNA polymerase factor sigma-54 [Halobacillus naozhouensis]WFT73988.1 RNA polymerase factor sigma-54 [Halobacillus naozhouensis]